MITSTIARRGAPWLLTLLAGCADEVIPTQLVVRLHADAEVAAGARCLRVESEGGPSVARDEAAVAVERWPQLVVVSPRDGDADRTVSLTMRAFETFAGGECAGDELATVRAGAGFVENRAVLLELRFFGACLGVQCGSDETCNRNGQCVPAPFYDASMLVDFDETDPRGELDAPTIDLPDSSMDSEALDADGMDAGVDSSAMDADVDATSIDTGGADAGRDTGPPDAGAPGRVWSQSVVSIDYPDAAVEAVHLLPIPSGFGSAQAVSTWHAGPVRSSATLLKDDLGVDAVWPAVQDWPVPLVDQSGGPWLVQAGAVQGVAVRSFRGSEVATFGCDPATVRAHSTPSGALSALGCRSLPDMGGLMIVDVLQMRREYALQRPPIDVAAGVDTSYYLQRDEGSGSLQILAATPTDSPSLMFEQAGAASATDVVASIAPTELGDAVLLAFANDSTIWFRELTAGGDLVWDGSVEALNAVMAIRAVRTQDRWLIAYRTSAELAVVELGNPSRVSTIMGTSTPQGTALDLAYHDELDAAFVAYSCLSAGMDGACIVRLSPEP